MIQAQDRTIGDYTYTIRQMPATAAQTMFTKLIKLFGASLKGIAGASGKVDIIAAVVGSFAERLDEAEVTKLINTMMAYIEVHFPEGKGVMPMSKVFETHFHGGNLLQMFKLVGAFLEVNFSDFFGDTLGSTDIKSLLASVLASAQPSKSQSTSTGSSGA